MKISGRQLQIPRSYIDLDPQKDFFDGDVLLGYVLPEYDSYPSHPQERVKRRELIHQGRMKGMLLEASESRPSFDVMVSNFKDLKGYSLTDGDVYGLEKHTAPQREGRYAEEPDDMFIERGAAGEVKSFMFCSPPGKYRIPGCNHRFRDNGILYKTRWKLSELPRWNEQRDAAISFLEQCEISE